MHLFIHITNTWRLLYVMVPVLCDRFVATSKADTIPVLLIFFTSWWWLTSLWCKRQLRQARLPAGGDGQHLNSGTLGAWLFLTEHHIYSSGLPWERVCQRRAFVLPHWWVSWASRLLVAAAQVTAKAGSGAGAAEVFGATAKSVQVNVLSAPGPCRLSSLSGNGKAVSR